MKSNGVVKEWAFIDRWPYRAPEDKPGLCLSGKVIGHESITDGGSIVTNIVVGYDNKTKTITTKSGSLYILVGEPAEDWVKWCESMGYKPQDYFDRLGEQ